MYAIYRQTDAPTGIDFAIHGRFLNLYDYQLATAGANILHIYRLNKNVGSLSADGQFVASVRLECILSSQFSGSVADICSCLIPGHKRETLVLVFCEAKISFVEYDPETNDLRTISLHSYEDEMLKGGFTRYLMPPMVTCDPDNRCIALLCYGRHLAVIPLQRYESAHDESSSTLSQSIAGTISLQSYIMPVETLDDKLHNIKAVTFLYGCYEPSVLFLFEPQQTTAGRVAVRMDTYCILAVSLNIKEQTAAVIWSMTLLPYDCFKCLAVPKPIGGVLVFAANSMIYLNQAVPPFGVMTNSNGRGTTQFPLKPMEDMQITFDGCVADFLSSKTLVMSLRSGDLYVVSFLVDSMATVKSLHFDLAASSVIPSVACTLQDGYLFLGSRLGNSLLLSYAERQQLMLRIETKHEPAAKRMRVDNGLLDDADGFDDGHHQTEDVDLYGEVIAIKTEENIKIMQYQFEVLDSLVNIAPCKSMTIGEPPSIPDEYQRTLDPVLDFVFASGHAKNGSLTVCHRSVRPHLITSSPIHNAQQLWTVGATQAHSDGVVPGAQKFLLISKEVDTMVLEMKAEITELDSTGFEMNQRTVVAGDMDNGEYIVQICPMKLVLLKNAEKIQELPLDSNFPISQASIVDPFIVLLMDNGEIMLAILEQNQREGGNSLLTIILPKIHQNIPASAVSVYKDTSGMFKICTNESLSTAEYTVSSSLASGISTDVKPAVDMVSLGRPQNVLSELKRPIKSDMSLEDEDELLYGDNSQRRHQQYRYESAAAVKHEHAPPIHQSPLKSRQVVIEPIEENNREEEEETEQPPTTTYWAFVARENGLLEIFSLPDFKLVYMVKRFPFGHATLFDTDPIRLALEAPPDRPDESLPTVREMLMVGMGPNNSRPHLFAIVEQELLVFEAFPYKGEIFLDHLEIRFRKVNHNVLLRNHRYFRNRRKLDGLSSFDGVGDHQLFPFENIGGYSGVFVAGQYPYWIFMGSHGYLRMHPQNIDGPVRCFAPFHNINCLQGFVYLTGSQDRFMRICQLQQHINYDTSCPLHKVQLKQTSHFVVYLLDSRTYAVALSQKKVCNQIVTLIGDEKQFEPVDRNDPNFVYPTMDVYSIQLFTPESWESIPGANIDMEEFEHVTVLKEVQLKSEGTVSGLQNYLAAGTVYNYGEEVMIRGRVFICEIIEVVPEPGQPLTRNKMKILYAKEQKGPVTSMCSVLGYLLTGMGQKVYIWLFKDNDLVGISFLDMQVYVHLMISLRSIVVTGDAFKSICLLRYQEQCKALSLASRDLRRMEVYALEFLVDNKQLAFLCSDGDHNLHIYSYHPEAKESLGGQRLLRRGSINLGQHVQAMYRLRSHVGDPVIENKTLAINRHVVLIGTLDGGLGFVLPLPEKTYRRLLMLQNMLTTFLPQSGGLNPRQFRALHTPDDQSLNNPQKNFLDGDLIWRYLHLAWNEKHEVAKRIGTYREQILDDLLEIQRMSTHY